MGYFWKISFRERERELYRLREIKNRLLHQAQQKSGNLTTEKDLKF